MVNTIKDRLLGIPVIPSHLEVSDVCSIRRTAGGLLVDPTHYRVSIFISGLVLQQLMKWSIKEGYVLYSGNYVIPNRTKKEKYRDTSKKENDAT